MREPSIIRATPLEVEWLRSNFRGCRPLGKNMLAVPDVATVEDALYNEIRDSSNIARQTFFRKLRLKLITAPTLHEPTRDPLDMNSFVPADGTVRFEPAWIPEEEDEDDEEFF